MDASLEPYRSFIEQKIGERWQIDGDGRLDPAEVDRLARRQAGDRSVLGHPLTCPNRPTRCADDLLRVTEDGAHCACGKYRQTPAY